MTFLSGPDLSGLLNRAEAGLDSSSDYAGFYPVMCRTEAVIANEKENPAPLTALAHLAYGWMPTIMKRMALDHYEQKDLVGRLITCTNIGAAEEIFASLETQPINNSWVGTSKVFHFLAPNAFPIWDSKVARHFAIHYAGAVNSKKSYAAYLSYVKAKHSQAAVRQFCEIHLNKWGYDISPIRGLELLLFASAPPARKQKNKS